MYLDKFKAQAEFLHDEEINMTEFREVLSLLVDIAIAANNIEKAKKAFDRAVAFGEDQLVLQKRDIELYDAEMALTEALIEGKVFGLFEEEKESNVIRIK